jgi:Domain of unknown function (DUF5069)
MNEKAIRNNRVAPRGARVQLGAYLMAARTLDKCRADLADRAGSYHYNCPLDRVLFNFTGINAEEFKDFVATGAGDEEVAQWIEQKSQIRDPDRVAEWNRKFRMNPVVWLLELHDWLHTHRSGASLCLHVATGVRRTLAIGGRVR